MVGVVVVLVTTMANKNKKIAITTKPGSLIEKKETKPDSTSIFENKPDSTSNKDVKEIRNKKKKIIDKKKPRVYLEIEIDGINKGRIIIELFDDRLPNTAENFRNLCKGFNTGSPGQVLHYTGSKFHLIDKGLAAQAHACGEYASPSGYRFVKVTDANIGKHDEPYLVSMANYGEELTIGSQFFITFSSLPHVDGKHVVVGKVVEGFNVLHEMEGVKTTLGKPKVPVVIVDCGEIVQETDAGRE
uniref:peptidyl-prolyl cis-trans isomerase CYP18-3-like n=1 Tax=Fragaria vesca subsp. vesca TaxID=101020 RepID=UPI0005C9D99B|nr:PREDICTED: peptidyl-prolyl cis-trans isomerase CYP18-3-like [Fragaria vesca subsp. vesca]